MSELHEKYGNDGYCNVCSLYHNCLEKCPIMDLLVFKWSKKNKYTPAIAEECIKQIEIILKPN